jgi:hypothetical protein|nr:MAG TPA: hypothetical protein [Myoviridae sp. ctTS62]
MAQKLDIFKGKITSKSSPKEINKTLTDLQAYLEKYEEKDAAKVVDELKSGSSKGSHQDKILSKQFIKLYSKRTDTLERIAKSIKRMQEDFVDEQDTSIKKRGVIGTAKSKVVGGLQATKNAISTAKDKAKSGFDLIGDLMGKFMNLKNLLPMILGGITSLISGALMGIASKVFGKILKVIGWIGKVPLKIAKWLIKKVGKVGLAMGKMALKAFKFIGGMIFKVGAKIAKFALKGLGKLGNMLGDAWRKIKDKVKSTVKPKSKAVDPKAKADAKSKTGKAASNNTKTQVQKAAKTKGNEKGWLEKGKEAIESVKKKIIPSLEKTGSKGIAKAVGKALGKVASKAFPIIGWGLLAYDAYSAAKKSDSLTSFGVNLLDEASGGLISMALGNTGGKSAGQYIESLIEEGISTDANANNTSNASSYSGTAATGASSIAGGVLNSPLMSMTNNSLMKPDTSGVTVGEVQSVDNKGNPLGPVYDKFYNEYHNHKSFAYYNDKILKGEMTVAEAIRALGDPIGPSVNSSTTIVNRKSEELKLVKEAAVAESVKISSMMDKTVVNGMSGVISGVSQSVTEVNMNVGNQDPNRAIRLNGNQAQGDYQG